MPHIFVENFKPFSEKIENDEVEFLFTASEDSDREHYLIPTRFRDKEFFLEVKRKDRGYIIKSEKHTRPSPNYPLHRAIDSLSRKLGLEPLTSNLNLQESQHLKYRDRLRELDHFSSSYDYSGEVWIEIGFGSGRHLLHQAEANPDVKFIGIEIHKPSIEQVLKQIEIQGITNIDVLDFDARHFLESIPSNSIDKIFVHFPVPWDKKPHRRVIKDSFLQEAKRVLSVGGKLELRTDSENYFQSSMELFLSEKELQMELFKNIPIDVISKYEARWRKQEKNIYDMHITNREKSENSQPITTGEFSGENFNTDKIENMVGETIRKDEWFISFKSIYSIESGGKLLHIVMGSYNYPETTFLFVSKKRVEYLIKKAIPIGINREIENYLRELL